MPSAPITRAPSALARPVAAATPSTAATSLDQARREAAPATCSPSNSETAIFGLAEMPTSVCEYALANTASKERLSVSVTTNAPATNITPSTTARPDRMSLQLAGQQALQRGAQHQAATSPASSSFFMVSSTVSAVGSVSSLTISPSARNTTRSA